MQSACSHYVYILQTTTEKKPYHDNEGLIQYAFLEPSVIPITSHHLYHYFVGDFPGRQVIIIDKNFHGVLVVSHDFKVAIVSLPQFNMDYKSGKKHLFGLLGNA